MLKRLSSLFFVTFHFLQLHASTSIVVNSEIDDSSRQVKRYHVPMALKERASQELSQIFKQQNILQRLQIYLDQGGNPNLVDNYGTGLLHMTACYGFQDITILLIERHAVNAMAIDQVGFVPGDYARMALIKGHHHNSRLEADLNAYENTSFQRRIDQYSRLEVPALGSFMQAFDQRCHELLMANQVLNSGLVARALNYLEPSVILSFLGNILPIPGGGTITEIVAIGADAIAEQRAQHQRNQYFSNAPKELSREFKKLAYVLSQRYEAPIQELSVEGARRLGEYCAGKIKDYLEGKDAEEINKTQSFINQILEYLGKLSVKGTGFSTKVRRQQGGEWVAKAILVGSSDIPKTSWPLPLMITAEAEASSFDQAEIVRLEALLNDTSEVVVMASSNLSSTESQSIPPVSPPVLLNSPTEHSTGDITARNEGVAVGILGANGRVGDVHVEKGSLGAGVVIEEEQKSSSIGRSTVGAVTADGGNAYGVFVGNISMFLPKK